jgi:hypothetical protein
MQTYYQSAVLYLWSESIMKNDREGAFVYLYDIDKDQDDEDTINGLEGKWSFNPNTVGGEALEDELEEIRFKISEEQDTDEDNKRQEEIAIMIEKDISKILGYNVTIQSNTFIYFDNDAEPGRWFKINP